MKVTNKTKLTPSASSYRIEIDADDLSNTESLKDRYRRYLEQLRRTARIDRSTSTGLRVTRERAGNRTV